MYPAIFKGAPISTQGGITLAGSFEAFGNTTGTGATADRNIFGWVAGHGGNITQTQLYM